MEQRLASRHLHDGSLVLYDVTSTYFEGRCCPLAQLGHPRDGKKDKLQIVFGLLCSRDGCPVAVEVFDGNTGDPTTLGPQLGQSPPALWPSTRVVMVGDRGMLPPRRDSGTKTFAGVDGLGWISALRTTEIPQTVRANRAFRFSLFDRRDMVEPHSPDFLGERADRLLRPLAGR